MLINQLAIKHRFVLVFALVAIINGYGAGRVEFGAEVNCVGVYTLPIKRSTSVFTESDNFATIRYYIRQL
jgi:hypothetical protein